MNELQDALIWWDTMLMDPEGHEPIPVPEGKAIHIHAFVEAARRVTNGKRQWFCDDNKNLWDDPGCEFIYPDTNHDKCDWVLVLGITYDHPETGLF